MIPHTRLNHTANHPYMLYKPSKVKHAITTLFSKIIPPKADLPAPLVRSPKFYEEKK